MNTDIHDTWSSELAALLLCTTPRYTFFDPPSVQFFDHDVDAERNSSAFNDQNVFEITQEATSPQGEHRSMDDSVTHAIFSDIDGLQCWDLLHTSTDGTIPRDVGIPSVHEVSHSLKKRHIISGPITHSTPKHRKDSQYDGAYEDVVSLPTDAATGPTHVSIPGRMFMSTGVSECPPGHLRMSGCQRQLQLVFLPAQKDAAEGITKYGKVAEIIQLRDGMLKLFVERGRLIETRISVTPSIDMDQPLKIRFLPYSSLGGVHRPVVGHENAVQPGHFSQIRQLCFVQLSDSFGHHYNKDENGYLYVETVLLEACTIHQLVFPFLNSQCPTARRTEVYVRVTVIQSDGIEVCGTTFQVVSCASPYRDANRFRLRHCNGDSSASDTHAGNCDLDMVDSGNWSTEFRAHNITHPELDISPSSSGFVSLCSPGTTGIQEDDSMLTIEAILSEHKPREFSLTCTGHRNAEDDHQQSDSNGNNRGLAPERNTTFGRMNSLQYDCDHFLTGSKRAMYDSTGVTGPSKREAISQKEDSGNHKAAANSDLLNTSDRDKGQDCEYIIKTKSRRMYEILLTLHQKLLETFGDL